MPSPLILPGEHPSPAGGTSSVFAFGKSTFPKGEGSYGCLKKLSDNKLSIKAKHAKLNKPSPLGKVLSGAKRMRSRAAARSAGRPLLSRLRAPKGKKKKQTDGLLCFVRE